MRKKIKCSYHLYNWQFQRWSWEIYVCLGCITQTCYHHNIYQHNGKFHRRVNSQIFSRTLIQWLTRQLTISFYTATAEMSQTPINCDGVRTETSSLLSQTHINNKLHTWVPAQSRTNGLTNIDHWPPSQPHRVPLCL